MIITFTGLKENSDEMFYAIFKESLKRKKNPAANDAVVEIWQNQMKWNQTAKEYKN